RNALETLAGHATDRPRVLRRRGDRTIARHRLEIVETQLQSDRLAGVALASKVLPHTFAQAGEDPRNPAAVARRMQVAGERGLAADRLRLAERDDRPLVASMRGLVQPRAVMLAEMLEQPARVD